MQQAKSHLTWVLISHFAKVPQSLCLLLHTLFICTRMHFWVFIKWEEQETFDHRKMAPITHISKFVPKKIGWNWWHLMRNKIFTSTGNNRRRKAEIFIKNWQIRDFAARVSTRTSSWPDVFLIFTNQISKRGRGQCYLSFTRAAGGQHTASSLAMSLLLDFSLDQLYSSSSPIIFPYRESFTLSSWRAAHGLLPSTRLASPPLPPIVWKRDHLGRDSSAMHTANSYDKLETASHAKDWPPKNLLRLHLKGGAGNWHFDPRSKHEVASARR